ncbi:hypothetical protein BGZ65_000302, partial [Modicella reniformis]
NSSVYNIPGAVNYSPLPYILSLFHDNSSADPMSSLIEPMVPSINLEIYSDTFQPIAAAEDSKIWGFVGNPSPKGLSFEPDVVLDKDLRKRVNDTLYNINITAPFGWSELSTDGPTMPVSIIVSAVLAVVAILEVVQGLLSSKRKLKKKIVEVLTKDDGFRDQQQQEEDNPGNQKKVKDDENGHTKDDNKIEDGSDVGGDKIL